jgi:hypothetical protein
MAKPPYTCLDDAEGWIIVHRGAIAFRFGPYTGSEAGAILAQCQREEIPCMMTFNVGQEFDWTMARDMRGYPQGEEPKMEHETPFTKTTVYGFFKPGEPE